jgi:uncharacterized membrane protein
MDEPRPAPEEWIDREEAGFDRAVGFFDATFALALTLLVTTLDIDNRQEAFQSVGNLWDAIGGQLLGFGIAFAVISNYWLVHHRLLRRFAGLDYPMIVTNLFLMAAIVLLPFCTDSVGDVGTEELPLPVAMMAVDIVAASVLSTLVFLLAVRRRLLLEQPDRREVISYALGGLAPALVFAASIPVAYLVSARAGTLTWLLLLVLAPIVPRLARFIDR